MIEEKQPNIELLVKDALYSRCADRPVVVGKHDERGSQLVPGYGGLDADSILAGLARRLEPRLGDRLAPARRTRSRRSQPAARRSPARRSTARAARTTARRRCPTASLVGAGIGCHTMALLMDPERASARSPASRAMGNEGTQWIGMCDFVEREHFIQNLGDGTYFHSGQLADHRRDRGRTSTSPSSSSTTARSR